MKRVGLILAVAVALLAVSSASAAPAPSAGRADECMRQPAFKSVALLLHGRAGKMGPTARRQCGGAYPIVISIFYGLWMCDWGPGSSPRYTTRPGGC